MSCSSQAWSALDWAARVGTHVKILHIASYCAFNRISSVSGAVGGRGDGVTKWREGSCYELASVSEHETHVTKRLTTCTSSSSSSTSSSSSATSATAAAGAISRERRLYQSTTHSIELRLAAGSPAHRRLGRFLIKYEGNWSMNSGASDWLAIADIAASQYIRIIIIIIIKAANDSQDSQVADTHLQPLSL